MVDVLLGLQWGDEGKGKIVDFLAQDYDIIARFQGGPNAGHTLYVEGAKVVLHTIPSGVFQPKCLNLIGNGVVIDPVTLVKEIANIRKLVPDFTDRLYISDRAHIIIPTHRALDAASEHAKGKGKIGSTLKGIGPAYMDKTGRNGLRIGDLKSENFHEKYKALKLKHEEILERYEERIDISEWETAFLSAVEELRTLNIISSEYWLNEQITNGKKVLAEGAQGSMLDIDFGTYPFVTSSNTITAGVCAGLGIPPTKVGKVYGITKAYCTRVGSGPFPTELEDETGEALRKAGNEFGATTGRPRRCGWIDLVALRYAILLSGVDELIITKADVLDGFAHLQAATAYKVNGQLTEQFPYDAEHCTIEPVYNTYNGWQTAMSKCSSYESSPEEFKTFLKEVERFTGAKVKYVSNGTGRENLLRIF